MLQNKRLDVWETDYEVYSESQIERILDQLEIEVVGETHTHFQTYCPFHDNTDSPAFVVDKEKGLWTCFNPACQEAGTLEELIRKVSKCTPFKAQMIIAKSKNETGPIKRKKMEPVGELREFPQSKLDELYRNFKGSPAQSYMYGRGFTDETMEYFRVGYSPERYYPKYRPEMVTVPMHDVKGKPIGLVGRSIVDKRFKNSTGLPKKMTAWNIHRAKREGDTVIVCEATFDAMRIHQAGYPNVIALLGGHVTQYHLEQMDRFFSTVIIMTDFELDEGMITFPSCRKCAPEICKGHRPGRDLGRSIVKGLPNKKILWASYDDTTCYPRRCKDAGDMTDEEIAQCLRNAISNSQYKRWEIEEKGLR